jgi:chemotaxis response regulator CheB
MSGIRTILADDAVAVRDTIAQLLALEPDIEVLGGYGDGHQALAEVRASRPDVAVLAVDLPGLDGIAVTEAIADTGTRVLIRASMTASGGCRAAMRAGALGYVATTAPSYRLVAAVRAVARGERRSGHDPVDRAGTQGAPRRVPLPVHAGVVRDRRPAAGGRRHGDVHAAGQDRRTGQAGRGADRDHSGMAVDPLSWTRSVESEVG